MIFGVILGSKISNKVYEGEWKGAKAAVTAIAYEQVAEILNEASVLKYFPPFPFASSYLFLNRAMRHPNIVQFYGFTTVHGGADNHFFYIVTEFVEGHSLEYMLQNKGYANTTKKSRDSFLCRDMFSFPDFVRLARHTAAGMVLLEERGILLRNLSAHSLMVQPLPRCWHVLIIV